MYLKLVSIGDKFRLCTNYYFHIDLKFSALIAGIIQIVRSGETIANISIWRLHNYF